MISAIKLTADLIQRRNDMRVLLGPRYEQQVTEARGVLRGCAMDWRMDLAETALEIGRKMDAAGVDPSVIFAALVDEAEGGE